MIDTVLGNNLEKSHSCYLLERLAVNNSDRIYCTRPFQWLLEKIRSRYDLELVVTISEAMVQVWGSLYSLISACSTWAYHTDLKGVSNIAFHRSVIYTSNSESQLFAYYAIFHDSQSYSRKQAYIRAMELLDEFRILLAPDSHYIRLPRFLLEKSIVFVNVQKPYPSSKNLLEKCDLHSNSASTSLMADALSEIKPSINVQCKLCNEITSDWYYSTHAQPSVEPCTLYEAVSRRHSYINNKNCEHLSYESKGRCTQSVVETQVVTPPSPPCSLGSISSVKSSNSYASKVSQKIADFATDLLDSTLNHNSNCSFEKKNNGSSKLNESIQSLSVMSLSDLLNDVQNGLNATSVTDSNFAETKESTISTMSAVDLLFSKKHKTASSEDSFPFAEKTFRRCDTQLKRNYEMSSESVVHLENNTSVARSNEIFSSETEIYFNRGKGVASPKSREISSPTSTIQSFDTDSLFSKDDSGQNIAYRPLPLSHSKQHLTQTEHNWSNSSLTDSELTENSIPSPSNWRKTVKLSLKQTSATFQNNILQQTSTNYHSHLQPSTSLSSDDFQDKVKKRQRHYNDSDSDGSSKSPLQPLSEEKLNTRNGTRCLESPCQGVCWDPTHQRWVAHWSDSKTHQRIRKYFNPKILGFNRARLLAVLTRKEAVDSGQASMTSRTDQLKKISAKKMKKISNDTTILSNKLLLEEDSKHLYWCEITNTLYCYWRNADSFQFKAFPIKNYTKNGTVSESIASIIALYEAKNFRNTQVLKKTII